MSPAPLVLLPGLLCTARVWRHVVATLGHHRRILTPCVHSHADISQQASAILNEIDAEQFDVAGFSYGGYLALQLLHDAPSRVSRVALISSQARTDSDSTRDRRLAQIATAQSTRSVLPILRAQLPLLLHPRHMPDAQQVESMLASCSTGARTDEGGERYPSAWDVMLMAHDVGVDGFIAQQRSIMSRKDRRHDLMRAAARGVPLLLASAVQDALIPRAVQADMGKHARGAATHSCVVRSEAGHMLPLEQPEELVQAMLTWLATPAAR